MDSFLYHLGKCGKGSFKKLEHTRIHTCCPRNDDEEDIEDEEDEEDEIEVDEYLTETNYCNGNNEVVEFFI